MVSYKKVKCKSFLHHFNKQFLPFNWGANPYRGCEHSCPYCFARYTHEYLGYNQGGDFDTTILVKVNAAEVLDKELSRKNWRKWLVSIGTVCDPYQPAEKEFRITRSILEVFSNHKNPILLTTKSHLILRDLDLLSEMAKKTSVSVNFTITTLSESVREKTEPRASPTSNRLQAMRHLADAGVSVGALYMPIFPYITDSHQEIEDVVSAIANAGARWIIPGVLHMRSSCRSRVFRLIKQHFPQHFEKYRELYKKSYAPKEFTRPLYRAFGIAYRRNGFRPQAHQKVFQKKPLTLDRWMGTQIRH